MSNIILYDNPERTSLFGSGEVGGLIYMFYSDFAPSGYWSYGSGEAEVKIYCFTGSGLHDIDPNAPAATSLFSLAQAAVVDDDVHTLYLQSGAKLLYKHSSTGTSNPDYNRLTIYPMQVLAGGTYHDVTINSIPASDCFIEYDRQDYALEGIYLLQCDIPIFEDLRNQGLPQPKVAVFAAKLIDRNSGSVGSYIYIRGYEINIFEITDSERYTPVRTSRKGGGGRGVYPSTAAEQPNTAARNSWFSWASFYKLIGYCNLTLAKGPEVLARDNSFTESDWLPIQAELVGMRALAYFYLVRAFRDVPFVIKSNDTSVGATDPVPQTASEAILSFLINDLEAIKDNGMTNYGNDADNHGRFTKNALYTLLADIYLWRAAKNSSPDSIAVYGEQWKNDYAKCVECCDYVINAMNYKMNEEGVKHYGKNDGYTPELPLMTMETRSTSYETYNSIFGDKNSHESIF